MATGIRVYNLDGSTRFDIGTRLMRKIGVYAYGVSNGSVGFTRDPADTRIVPVVAGFYSPVFTVDIGNNILSWDVSLIPVNSRYGGTVELWAS